MDILENLDPIKISLDFYRRNVITITAKEYDHKSRYVEITCTANGKKVKLDNTATSAYVRYRKPDGHYVLSQVVINDDGLIILNLIHQMLFVSGTSTVDVMLLNTTEVDITNIADIINAQSLEGVSILSTMSFNIYTEACPINSEDVESADEYSALVTGLAGAQASLEKADTATQNAEIATQNAIEATDEAKIATEEAITAKEDTVIATQNAVDATDEAIVAKNNAETATKNAQEQADRAEAAADKIDSIIAGEVVMKTEKGVANGVASLDENALIPNEQINTKFEMAELKEIIDSGESFEVILGKIAIYMQTINAMLQKSSDSTENIPILLASSPTPVEGDFTGASYNTGVTINPSEKSINSEIIKVGKKVIIGNGDATLELENNGEEKMIKLSFAE